MNTCQMTSSTNCTSNLATYKVNLIKAVYSDIDNLSLKEN